MKSETTTFYRYFPVSRRDKGWGVYATTAGESHIAPHFPYPPSGHPKNYSTEWKKGRVLDEFQFVYISSGAGNFESDSSPPVRIGPGHAFLLFPGIWHRYAPDPEIGWGEHWIGFNGDTARHWHRSRFISVENPILKINAPDATLLMFSRIMQFIRSNHPALQQILAGSATYLIALFYSAQQAQQALPAIGMQTRNTIELAIAHINSEFAHHLDMKLIAEKAGVSYSWFRNTFSAYTGLGPHQYLLELRLAYARKLLVETDLSIKEVAAQTGFEDENYFSRIFRRKLNVTAGQFRGRNQQQKQMKSLNNISVPLKP